MVIAGGEVVPYRLPFRRDYGTARGTLRWREMALLRLSGPGAEGWGEAVPLSLRGGESLTLVIENLESWLEAHAEREVDWRTGEAHGPGVPSTASRSGGIAALPAPARCAILTALADLEGRLRGEPVWRLLGAERSEPIACNATLVSGSPDAVAEDAAEWSKQGFETFKLKLGAGTGADDLAQIEAVRDAVGPGARLRLDANGAWSLAEAARILAKAARFGIELVEQPVTSLEEMVELRRRLVGDDPVRLIPVAADESVGGPEEAEEAAARGACELATVKLSKVGRLDSPLGGFLPFYMSSALDGPVGIAAAAHALQAVPTAELAAVSGSGGGPPHAVAHGLATQRLFESTIAKRSCELRGPMLHMPDGPGLGVEIDHAALAKHRL